MLQPLREKIDHVDEALIPLLEERMQLVSEVVDYKNKHHLPTLDKQREEAQKENLVQFISHEEYKETILAIFEDILKQSKAYQDQRREKK